METTAISLAIVADDEGGTMKDIAEEKYKRTGALRLIPDADHLIEVEAITESFETSAKAFDDLYATLKIQQTIEGECSTIHLSIQELKKIIQPFANLLFN